MAPCECKQCADLHQAQAAHPVDGARGDQEAREGCDRREEQQESQSRRRKAKHVDGDVRCTGHERVDHAHHAGAEDEVGQVGARAEELPVTRPWLWRQPGRRTRGPRLDQLARREQHHDAAQEPRQGKHRLPVVPLDHEAAERRRKHRREQDGGCRRRDGARGARRPEEIHDGRPHDGHRRAAAEGLDDARDHQEMHGWRDDPAEAAGDEQAEPSEHDGPAAIAVRQRRDDEIAERDRDQRQADQELRGGGGRAHRGCDRRQRRQQHVQAEGPDRADDRRADDQPAGGVEFLQAFQSFATSCGARERPATERVSLRIADCLTVG